MIELITGTPGSCKTATAVADICMSVPGSFIEAQDRCVSHGVTYEKGERVPRHLYSNITGLLVEHEYIDDESMRKWPEWAQPGDFIVFDEAQSLWRQRAVGSKVPEEVQALETHRHLGIDFGIVTQHPMLLDSNVRRLVNRHRHLRKLPGGWVYEYEWDHCGQPGAYRSCIRSGPRRIPKRAFPLYKSAQLHTKSPVKPPLLLMLVGLGALGVAGYAGPDVYQRIAHRAENAQAARAPESRGAVGGPRVPRASAAPVAAASVPAVPVAVSRPRYRGCIVFGPRCSCFDDAGMAAEVSRDVCEEGASKVGGVVPLALASWGASEAPPPSALGDRAAVSPQPEGHVRGAAAAAPSASGASSPSAGSQ